MQTEILSTSRKALSINLDPEKYGSFAEIGAGQEVARQFFQAGGASGTIAKSMSAYNMKFSDEIYGKCERYVSHERLQQMIEHEYQLLEDRLSEDRGAQTGFFSFANTVAVKGYHGSDECHGWMGVRFQHHPLSQPNDILLHVCMLDGENLEQQEAIGILGVNLIYGAMYLSEDLSGFMESLMDNLNIRQIEIDRLEFHGSEFSHIDNRLSSFKLVEKGLTHAVMLGPNESVLQPSEVLYKKAIIVERGRYQPMTWTHMDILKCAGSQFIKQDKVKNEKVVTLLEINMHVLRKEGSIDYDDIFSRIEVMTHLGYHVLISNYFEFYRLVEYFRRYTSKMIGIALGINTLLEIFDEQHYLNLKGGLLEASGRLFEANVRLYVYPMKVSSYRKYLENKKAPGLPEITKGMDADDLLTVHNLNISESYRSLYYYLQDNQYIEAIVEYNPKSLGYFSQEVLDLIKAGDSRWGNMVPIPVANSIKEKKLWGYRKSEEKIISLPSPKEAALLMGAKC